VGDRGERVCKTAAGRLPYYRCRRRLQLCLFYTSPVVACSPCAYSVRVCVSFEVCYLEIQVEGKTTAFSSLASRLARNRRPAQLTHIFGGPVTLGRALGNLAEATHRRLSLYARKTRFDVSGKF